MIFTCLDLTSKDLINKTNDAPSFGKLKERLNYLFQTNIIPNDLFELSKCIREDGNDGVHDGSTSELESEDLLDFTTQVLKRIYTLPVDLREAEQRRIDRRKTLKTPSAPSGKS